MVTTCLHRFRPFARLQLVQLRVLIVEARGVGMETAKNLVLAGPAAVTIHDEAFVEMKDLGANFFLKAEHVGARRGASVINQLKDLNHDVEIKTSRQWYRAQGACRGSVCVLAWRACSFVVVCDSRIDAALPRPGFYATRS